VIAAAITSQKEKGRLPTHFRIGSDECGLEKNSLVLLEQVRTIDKRRLREKVGRLNLNEMEAIDKALSISFGLRV
jgi:mRNA interferase MazF